MRQICTAGRWGACGGKWAEGGWCRMGEAEAQKVKQRDMELEVDNSEGSGNRHKGVVLFKRALKRRS